MAEHFDLLIRGGTLVDGSGATRRAGEVGVREGRIAAIGTPDELGGDADEIVDATGAVVSPGFIDVHTHYDAQLFWDSMLSPSPWHGVTTAVIGNCGFGVAPTRSRDRDLILRTLENVEGMSLSALKAGLGEEWPFESFPEYLDAVESRNNAINLAVLIGHTPLRTFVMGEKAVTDLATKDQVAEMKTIVTEALEAGAIGFASSKAPTHVGYDGNPVPSRVAAVEEINQIADALRDSPHGVLQATAGSGFFTKQFAEIYRRTGKPVSWTALLTDLMPTELIEGVLKTTTELQSEGVAVYPQVTGRPLMFEFDLRAPFPLESHPAMQIISKTPFDEREARYRDPEIRKSIIEAFMHSTGFGSKIPGMAISHHPADESLLERTLGDVAEERGISAMELAIDLSLETGLETRFRMAAANTDEAMVGKLLNHPATMLGLSDAGAHASQLCDAGASTHLLGHWVREKGALTLEEAVRRLTAQPAEIFGITDRGRLETGLAADIAIFDPETVGCDRVRRVHDFPGGADRLVADAFGMRAVIVNGVVLRENNESRLSPSDSLPGLVLRGGHA
ncbi:MAG TPA: amidohydrolase [Myxococcales bacterium]|nr:amidohydrolase [Myxococcales bacterium]HIM00395.1 amidohydrolase [Myxococcales bacterium]